MGSSIAPSRQVEVSETKDVQVVHELANAIWYPTYQNILAKEQIDFMLQKIYSPDSLREQLAEGQTFLLAKVEGVPVAFAAFSLLIPKEQVFKLNKIYIMPEQQGQGLGLLLLEEAIRRCKTLGGRVLELNVHRQNPAQYFYRKYGFTVHQTVDIPFGPFTLNDYIMRRPL